MSKYLISIRNHENKQVMGNTPLDAFSSAYPNVEIKPVDDPFFANICIELIGGQRKSKKYYDFAKPTQVSQKAETPEKLKLNHVVYIKDSLNNDKYVLREEYEGFGIYQRKTPTGYYVNQDWLVYNGKIGFQCEPYNNFCKEDLKDYIDYYNENGKFGLHGFRTSVQGIYGVHPNNKSCSF